MLTKQTKVWRLKSQIILKQLKRQTINWLIQVEGNINNTNFTILNSNEGLEAVPQTKIISIHAVKFRAGEENRIEYDLVMISHYEPLQSVGFTLVLGYMYM